MRLMFVYYLMNDAGSAQDIRNYTRVAEELGHEIVIYGRPDGLALQSSRDVSAADGVVFIFEWTTELRDGDALDFLRLVTQVPRDRRIVIDCDGAYNDALCVNGDYNHRTEAESRTWTSICEALADKIYQPTLHPLRPNVRTFFFHAYNPGWEVPVDFESKEYGMVYVGHSKFRWQPMKRVLRAIEPIRDRFGRIVLIGHGWDELPPWAAPMRIEDYYYTDKAFLSRIRAEIVEPVPSSEVIPWMSRALVNPVIYRPLFEYLQFVTCRTFETPAAGTIPVFGLSEEHVREIYGDEAVELVLPNDGSDEKIEDIVSRPEHYAEIVYAIRRNLAERHSYAARLRELVEMVGAS